MWQYVYAWLCYSGMTFGCLRIAKSDMNPYIKSIITFFVLLIVMIVGSFFLQTVVRHEPFVLDLAWVLGVSAAGGVLMLVHDLTAGE